MTGHEIFISSRRLRGGLSVSLESIILKTEVTLGKKCLTKVDGLSLS